MILTGKTDFAVSTGCHAGNLCCLKAELSGFFDLTDDLEPEPPALFRFLTPSLIC